MSRTHRFIRKLATIAAATTVIAATNTTPALAGTEHMEGWVTCDTVSGIVEGVYVVNSTSSARSGWANVWWHGSGQRYAFDGANSGDTVRVHVGCGNNWNPTFRSLNTQASFFNDIACSYAYGQPTCTI